MIGGVATQVAGAATTRDGEEYGDVGGTSHPDAGGTSHLDAGGTSLSDAGKSNHSGYAWTGRSCIPDANRAATDHTTQEPRSRSSYSLSQIVRRRGGVTE